MAYATPELSSPLYSNAISILTSNLEAADKSGRENSAFSANWGNGGVNANLLTQKVFPNKGQGSAKLIPVSTLSNLRCRLTRLTLLQSKAILVAAHTPKIDAADTDYEQFSNAYANLAAVGVGSINTSWDNPSEVVTQDRQGLVRKYTRHIAGRNR